MSNIDNSYYYYYYWTFGNTFNYFLACSSVSPDDASYSCAACQGSPSGGHEDVQAWLATCEGKREYEDKNDTYKI